MKRNVPSKKEHPEGKFNGMSVFSSILSHKVYVVDYLDESEL